jgi:hypothetical protein
MMMQSTLTVTILDADNVSPNAYIQLSYIDNINSGVSVANAIASAISVAQNIADFPNATSAVAAIVQTTALDQAAEAYQSCYSKGVTARVGCYAIAYQKVSLYSVACYYSVSEFR